MNYTIIPFNSHLDPREAVNLTILHYQGDIHQITSIDLNQFECEVAMALTETIYFPHKHFLLKAINEEHKIIGWSWLRRGYKEHYSSEEQAAFRFISLDKSINARTRIKIITEIMQHSIEWCKIINVPIINSTINTRDPRAFIKLHEKMGFICNGSFCYKRIIENENHY